LVLTDIISLEDAEAAALHAVLERLCDPDHIRMLSRSELLAIITSAGFELYREEGWQHERDFSQWAGIVSDPRRTGPIEQVIRSLGRVGNDAGIEIRETEESLRFTHSILLIEACAVD